MKLFSFFTTRNDSELLDHLPIQLEGEEAKAKRASMQKQVDILKEKMGNRHLLSDQIQRKT